jgi:hypothetical protein
MSSMLQSVKQELRQVRCTYFLLQISESIASIVLETCTSLLNFCWLDSQVGLVMQGLEYVLFRNMEHLLQG